MFLQHIVLECALTASAVRGSALGAGRAHSTTLHSYTGQKHTLPLFLTK